MPKVREHHSLLPFGERHAVTHDDSRSLAEHVDRVFPGLNAYDPLGQSDSFFAKTISLAFPSITVVASAMSPTLVDRNGRQHLTLMLPLCGKCSVTVGSQRIDWGAGHAGVLLPEYDGRIVGTGDTRTLMMLKLNSEKLAETARIMLGSRDETPEISLTDARPVPLQLYGRPVEPIIRQSGRVLDLLDCSPNALNWQGYEDWFNRLAVGLLCPELFADDSVQIESDKSQKLRVLDRLCEEMLESLGGRITLTTLEQKSGYSARTLQYAFKERYGCGPMEWLREQRLLSARQRVLAGDFQTIAQLAQQFGFGASSQFSLAYRKRFGESPTKLLKR